MSKQKKLPTLKQFEVLRLIGKRGYSIKRAANHIGITINAVKQRLYRSSIKLGDNKNVTHRKPLTYTESMSYRIIKKI